MSLPNETQDSGNEAALTFHTAQRSVAQLPPDYVISRQATLQRAMPAIGVKYFYLRLLMYAATLALRLEAVRL